MIRGNPGSVKTVLPSVVLAPAGYQLPLAAIGYEFACERASFRTELAE